MPEPTLKAKYVGSRDNHVDFLFQARALHSAALNEYRSLRSKLRGELAPRVRALRQSAKQSGYRAGMRKLAKIVDQVFRELDAMYVATIKQANQECLSLALSIAAELVASEVKNSAEGLLQRIEHRLSKLLDVRSISILIQTERSEQIANSLRSRLPDLHLSVRGCEDLEAGNAIIESAAGRIVLNWREELNLMANRLTDALERSTIRVEPRYQALKNALLEESK